MPAEHRLSPARSLRLLIVLVLTLGLATPVTLLAGRSVASAATASNIIDEAARHAGKPYRYGATGPDSFDCSGFTGYVFRQFGIELPRTSGAQRAALPAVPKDQKQVGDLIFTHDGGGGVYHVAIYAGNGLIWHSPSSGDVVKLSPIFNDNYSVGRTPLAPPSAIDAHYSAWGEVRAGLGAPTTDEFAVPGGAVKRYQNGQIVWSPASGAHAVQGAIFAKYGEFGFEQGMVGFPVSDELPIPGGRQSLFQNAEIVWSSERGAHVLVGDIRNSYNALGGTAGPLGYPSSSERSEPGGMSQSFAHGEIFWQRSSRRATALTGEVLAAYTAAGGPDGVLGMPVAVEGDGARVLFEKGRITYDATRRMAQVEG